MRTDQVTLADLGGGLNVAVSSTAIGANQFSVLENWDVIETKLRRRNGTRRLLRSVLYITPIQEIATAENVYGLHFFESGVLLLGEQSKFQVVADGGVIAVTIVSDEPIPASDGMWSMVDYKGIVWAGRRGSPLYRIHEALAAVAGIPAPEDPPVLANGGAGLIDTGDYEYFYTHVSALGDETDPSPIAGITLGAPSQVQLSGLVDSTKPQVVGKKIYRTLKNDLGQFWAVPLDLDTTFLPNGTLTFLDNVPDAELGDPYDVDNRLPPSEAYSVAKWQERLWTHNRKSLFASKVGKFETFSEQFDSFDTSGDREIRGVCPWDTRLMVGTTEQIFQVVFSGVDESGVRFTITVFCGNRGTVSHDSMKTHEGMLFWLARDGVYASVGGAPTCISTPEIEAIIHATDPTTLENACAYINEARNEYAISFGKSPDALQEWDVSGAPVGRLAEIQIVYNWRRGRWTTRKFSEMIVHKYDVDGETFIDEVQVHCAPIAVVKKEERFFASFGAFNVSEIETGNKDGRYQIIATARPKAQVVAGARSRLRKVHLDCTTVHEEITVRIFQDGNAAAVRENTVRLDQSPPRSLKRIGLGEVLGGTPLCNDFQAEIEYSGTAPLEINEVHFERDIFGIQGRSQ